MGLKSQIKVNLLSNSSQEQGRCTVTLAHTGRRQDTRGTPVEPAAAARNAFPSQRGNGPAGGAAQSSFAASPDRLGQARARFRPAGPSTRSRRVAQRSVEGTACRTTGEASEPLRNAASNAGHTPEAARDAGSLNFYSPATRSAGCAAGPRACRCPARRA